MNARPTGLRGAAPDPASAAAAALALALALACKLAYARATAIDLRWVLGPSCFVAEQVGGVRFAWDPAAGFVSHGARMVVGPPCAGVNFLVACSLALYFSSQAGFARATDKLSLCAASFAAGYLATITANGARIALAARLGNADFASHAVVHRLVGVLVYATALLAVCLTASRLLSTPRAAAVRRVAIPVACYLGVALALPLCHRALGHAAPGLAAHAAQTSLALALVAGLALLGDRLLDRIVSRRARLAARS